MSLDKSQLNLRANYLNLLLVNDDLKFFQTQLESHISSGEWLNQLRITRHIFIALNSVGEAIKKISLAGSSEYIDQTRKLRKTLKFIRHFRHKASGHLDTTLLKRAVQWHPEIFLDDFSEMKTMVGHIAVIEAAINSFQDDSGFNKVFKNEIDLIFPPDSKMFYKYIFKVIDESITWLSLSLKIISSDIEFNSLDEMSSMAAIAGQTDFNLKREAQFNYSEGDEDQFEKPVKDALKILKGLLREEGDEDQFEEPVKDALKILKELLREEGD